MSSLPQPSRQFENWRYSSGALSKFLGAHDKELNTKPDTCSISCEATDAVKISALSTISGVAVRHAEPTAFSELKSNSQGFLVEVLKSTDKPIKIKAEGSSKNRSTGIRVNVAAGASVIVWDESSSGDLFAHAIVDLNLSKGSQVTWVRASVGEANGVQIYVFNSRLQQDAKLQYVELHKYGTLNRSELNVKLEGERAEADLRGIIVVQNSETSDVQVSLEHTVGHTISRQMFKGVLTGSSRSVFNGGVYIPKDAQKSDSKQVCKHMILSRSAEVDAKPQLEVFADDVKATHGAAIGRLNDEEIFYLESRGIPKPEAQKILTAAFFDEVLLSIEEKKTREWLKSKLGDHGA